MHDPRCDRLAHLLVNFSTRLKPGEKVLIDVFDIPQEMTVALVRAARAAGAQPVSYTHLDVYKRQDGRRRSLRESAAPCRRPRRTRPEHARR